MIEALPIVIMCLLFTVPFALKRLWPWFWFFVCVSVLLGCWELGMHLATGQTLSQVFWEFSQAHPRSAIGIGVCLTGGWAILMAHLFWKMGDNEK